MATQEERRAATRMAIVEVAEGMFGKNGFEATSTDAIAAKAGVSKGSVFNHFATKRVMFDAVYEKVSANVAARSASAAEGYVDILEGLMEGVRAFFNACAEPAVSQIMLIDGPGVLGWEAWRARDAAHFGGLVKVGLRAAMDANAIRFQPIEPLTQMLLGAFQAAAIDCATSENFDVTADHYLQTTQSLLNGLK